jgi:hypothetical protein
VAGAAWLGGDPIAADPPGQPSHVASIHHRLRPTGKSGDAADSRTGGRESFRRRNTPPISPLPFGAGALCPAARCAGRWRGQTSPGDHGRTAGIGAGFTPAGDDFLLGAIYSIWAWAPEATARRLSDAIADEAAPRTTTVSGAYLRAGAAGAAGAGWHSLVAALAASDPTAMSSAVGRLCRIGHTSGADALTGFAVGVESLVPS